ncbi:hypothetical protein H8356DRAFT_1353884 [Neocallimastix lanati (nom. inval.)]|uniref:Uncharacterized protein n=1 Tax=Neocallimastix californiae TaxID=1754190 RepID=A0A1Y2CI73_9FUNG|nr:hypothetical protein H8356DRAFT_1353884 [Neocallimastix sp. JGI-2020a]ORY46712.1 hypothetical protein LY90DRAFT_509152 [Neocallimastix californiae]|eukprot:ORY46712.1 hypothetical protein LY90DRAFT_509152 [Neocallimastix californiae]
MAHGNIISSHSFNFHHNVSTVPGSSDAPLLNNNYKVVRVHKLWLSKEESETFVNAAVKFSEIEFAIRILYNNKFVDEKERARKSVRPLLDSEIIILNEYRLKFVLSFNEIKK